MFLVHFLCFSRVQSHNRRKFEEIQTQNGPSHQDPSQPLNSCICHDGAPADCFSLFFVVLASLCTPPGLIRVGQSRSIGNLAMSRCHVVFLVFLHLLSFAHYHRARGFLKVTLMPLITYSLLFLADATRPGDKCLIVMTDKSYAKPKPTGQLRFILLFGYNDVARTVELISPFEAHFSHHTAYGSEFRPGLCHPPPRNGEEIRK